MANPLRDRRTAGEWAAARQVVEIKEKLNSLEGLASIVESDLAALNPDKIPDSWRDSVVKGTMAFGFADAERRIPAAHCKVALTVDAVCQRCLEVFRLPIEAESKLLLLSSEEPAGEDFDDYEVWELEERTLRPQDIVEELLVMAMPLAAMHTDSASCGALPGAADDKEKTTRPFATLRAEMNKD